MGSNEIFYDSDEYKDIKPFSGRGFYNPKSLPTNEDPYYPNKQLKKYVETYGALSKVPVDTDILEPSRDNPLFYLLGFKSVSKLKKYIRKHREELQQAQSNQLRRFTGGLEKQPLDKQLQIVNACISKAGTRKDSKELAVEEPTAWDRLFENRMEKEKERIKDLIRERVRSTAHPGREPLHNKEDVKPTDERDWIEAEYSNNREDFKTDTQWAESTAKKFQQEFETKNEPSPGSMKRYGIYKGLK